MHLQGFTIDLDAPAGIAAELVDIIEAVIAHQTDQLEELEFRAEDAERQRDDEFEETRIQREGLAETILELETKMKSMSPYLSGRRPNIARRLRAS